MHEADAAHDPGDGDGDVARVAPPRADNAAHDGDKHAIKQDKHSPEPSTSTSESDAPTTTTDDEAEEEEAVEQQIQEEEEEERDREANPPGVTGYIRRALRRRWKAASGAFVDEVAGSGHGEPSPLDPLAPVDTRYLPILSGLACPFSVLLDIPGLTEPWYIQTQGYTIVATQSNPALLEAGLAISLALGVAANVCLLARFLEFRPKRYTLLAILALSLHDAINIAAVTWFGVSKRHPDGFNYGGPFWLTVASTVVSFICNITLVVDLVRTRNFVRKGSGLTERQRALVITVMILFLYTGLGALVYYYLIPDLSFLDSLFFVEVTIFTVGFGNPVPETGGAKVFTIFYASFGIVLFAVTVAVTRESIIETFENSYRSRRARLAQKAKERKELHLRRARQEAERRRLQSEVLLNDDSPADGDREKGTRNGRSVAKAAEHAEGTKPTRRPFIPNWVRRWFRRCFRPGAAAGDQTEKSGTNDATATDGGAAMDRRASAHSFTSTSSIDVSFRTLKEQLSEEERQEFRTKLTVSVSLFVVFWLGGAGIFVACESWTFGNAMWFAYETFSTIGYGDYIPNTAAGRAFFIPWSIVGIANMTLLFSVLSEAWNSRYKNNLQAGRVRRLVRRQALGLKQGAKPKAADSVAEARSTLEELMNQEGYDSVRDDPVRPEDLPAKIVETIRNFHSHARYFMLGRTGDPPPQLRVLLDAADQVDTQIDTLLAAKTSALAETATGRDTKHYLFMLSYEREFDRVIDSANQLSSAIQNASRELNALSSENERLQAELRQLKRTSSAVGEPADNVDGNGRSEGDNGGRSISRTTTLSFAEDPRASVAPNAPGSRGFRAFHRTHSFPDTNTADSAPSSRSQAMRRRFFS